MWGECRLVITEWLKAPAGNSELASDEACVTVKRDGRRRGGGPSTHTGTATTVCNCGGLVGCCCVVMRDIVRGGNGLDTCVPIKKFKRKEQNAQKT
jgi:hypothetical protein